YGADTARLFILFAAPPDRDLEWSESGVEGAYRFINRVWRLVQDYSPRVQKVQPTRSNDGLVGQDKDLRRAMHQTLSKVKGDIQRFNFNTAISSIMEYVNAFYQYDGDNMYLCREGLETLVLMLAPFVPHLAEELWQELGGRGSVHKMAWPQVDEEALQVEEMTIVLQVNGKVRDRVTVPVDITDDELKKLATSQESLAPFMEGKDVVKVILVPKKLVNIVVR
ncbi:MAG: class I tRNA ligase family protein, partial [Limnochordia bacterium]